MIQTRAPFYFNVVHPNAFVTKINFELITGQGFLSNITQVETTNITKLKPSPNTLNSHINISPYIRDRYEHKPIETTGTAAVTVRSSSSFALVLAKVTATPIDSLGSTLASTTASYICTDGYGLYGEGQNKQALQKILLSHSTYKADSRGWFIVPISFRTGDSNPTINGTPITIPDNFLSGGFVRYLVIPCSLYTGNIAVTFGGETINIELITECKYPVQEIQFLNRFGVFESMHFYKAAKEKIVIRSENFKNAYTNGVSYDVQRHQIQRYNVQSNKSVNIETGFLNPNYNFTIEELLQSEKVYLNGTPINVDTTSLDYKTRIVDKLISYNINFSQAFDYINNV